MVGGHRSHALGTELTRSCDQKPSSGPHIRPQPSRVSRELTHLLLPGTAPCTHGGHAHDPPLLLRARVREPQQAGPWSLKAAAVRSKHADTRLEQCRSSHPQKGSPTRANRRRPVLTGADPATAPVTHARLPGALPALGVSAGCHPAESQLCVGM